MSLQPFYNQLLNIKNSNGVSDEDMEEIVSNLESNYGTSKHAYLRFLLFPEINDPVRPAMMFPYPTHMYKSVGTMSLTASGGSLNFAWAPFAIAAGSGFGNYWAYWDGTATIVAGQTSILNSVTVGLNYGSHMPPTITGVSTNYIRGLAGFINITYIGSLDLCSGVIEVAIDVNGQVTGSDIRGNDYIGPSDYKNCYQYRKIPITEGARCIWLPITKEQLEMVGIDNMSNSLNMIYNVRISGASTAAGAFRVDYGYFYDAIVDTSGFNTLLPTKPKSNQPSNDSIVSAIRDDIGSYAVTPYFDGSNSFVTDLYRNLKSVVSGNIGSMVGKVVTNGLPLLVNTFIK